MLTSLEWSRDDRSRLAEWVGSNYYRFAFLVYATPVKPATLDRILRGYHEPKGLLAQRLRDVMERYPAGGKLPHPSHLLG